LENQLLFGSLTFDLFLYIIATDAMKGRSKAWSADITVQGMFSPCQTSDGI
jgi:hypothetical protein